VTESGAVWKDLGSRRIGKSLEEVRVRSDVKEHGFLIVCIYIAEIKGMMSEHIYMARWP